MTKVVVQLLGGNSITCEFPTRDEALRFVEKWANGQIARMNGSNLESSVITGGSVSDGESSRWQSAALLQYVIAMYIPRYEQTSNDRIADAQEKLADAVIKHECDGDEWKH